jgi:hypothetical protein
MIDRNFQQFTFIFVLCVIGFWIAFFYKLIKYNPSAYQANSELENKLIKWILDPQNASKVITSQFIAILILMFSCFFLQSKAKNFETMERNLLLQNADIDFYEGILINLKADMSDFEQQAIENKISLDSIKNSSEILSMNSRLLVFENGKLKTSLSKLMDNPKITVFGTAIK